MSECVVVYFCGGEFSLLTDCCKSSFNITFYDCVGRYTNLCMIQTGWFGYSYQKKKRLIHKTNSLIFNHVEFVNVSVWQRNDHLQVYEFTTGLHNLTNKNYSEFFFISKTITKLIQFLISFTVKWTMEQYDKFINAMCLVIS